jgi:hypothetical protein
MSLLAVLLACAPTTSPAEAMARALSPETPPSEALDACAQAGPSHEECVAAVVRARSGAARTEPDGSAEGSAIPADASPALAPDLSAACSELSDPRWRGECHFAVAERRAAAGNRQGAIEACAQAGPFYDECLYHAWTLELQSLASRPPAREASARLPDARDAIACWCGLQTIGPDARRQIEADWWFFAHARNRPARLAACDALEDPAEREGCAGGTRLYLRRSVVDGLRTDGHRARACRGGPEAARAALGELYVRPDPDLDAVFNAAVAEACATPAAPVDPADAHTQRQRPWNPTFRPRAAGPP